jgi:hypothetical protein
MLKLPARRPDSRKTTRCFVRLPMKRAHNAYVPTPHDLGLRIPRHLMEERFSRGFHHALTGGQITKVEQLRLSYREGYRAGKLYLKEVRRSRGIVEFPMTGKIRTRVLL